MWAYRSAEECACPVVLFDYQPGRGQEYPQAFLAGWHGMLISDDYAAWRTLDGPTHFGCLAHARRMFVDAIKAQSLLGKAIAYTRNQWQYLSRYVSDGRAPVDNNVIERDIRPFCTGRKSWLFSDSVAGAKASAMVYSLMLTCRACGVEPYAYLLHVLTELPQRAPEADITDLLPFRYAENGIRILSGMLAMEPLVGYVPLIRFLIL